MTDSLLRASLTELRTRLGRPVVSLVTGLACAGAVGQGLAPVFINGDPVARGLGSGAYGAAAGTLTGSLVAMAMSVGLVGGDIDRGMYAERLRTGLSPVRTAVAHGIGAVLVGWFAWALSILVALVGGAAELGVRHVADTPAQTVPPARWAVVTGAAGPAAIVVTVLLSWLLVVALRGAVNMGIATTTTGAFFTVALVGLPSTWRPILAVNPLGPVWRAVSATDLGGRLPGAVHGDGAVYALSALGWVIALAVAAARGTRRLGQE